MKIIGYILILLISYQLAAQNVGINTLNPRKKLEVAGDMIVSNTIEIQTTDNVLDTDETALLQQQPDNIVASLDLANSTTAAMAYVQKYRIENMQQDWINDFETNIDATEYVVVVVSAFYNQSLIMDINRVNYFAMQLCSSRVINGTWHLLADYPVAANVTGNNQVGVWEITTLIYPRNLTKQFGVVEYLLNNTTAGAAGTPILD